MARRIIWIVGLSRRPRLAHNGLVGGSNPSSPTTHSFEPRDFPETSKKPAIGGLRRRSDVGVSVSVETFAAGRPFWASCLWPSESRFPETETVVSRDAVRMSLLRNQTEHLTLARPFDREVAKSGHAHSMGKAPIDGRLDEIRREERE